MEKRFHLLDRFARRLFKRKLSAHAGAFRLKVLEYRRRHVGKDLEQLVPRAHIPEWNSVHHAWPCSSSWSWLKTEEHLHICRIELCRFEARDRNSDRLGARASTDSG